MSADNMGGRSLTEREMYERGIIQLTDKELKDRGWSKKESPKESPKDTQKVEEVSNK